ncbi:MAG: ADP-ribosylglycohydrolase family protein, partial [Pirellulales bacterium]
AATAPPRNAALNAFLGALVADALAMPVHWYYDQQALDRDYPGLAGRTATVGFLAPRNPHPDSILWRSSYTPASPQADILREQAVYWGRRGVHYHQFLEAGDNTLNSLLAVELFRMLRQDRDYDPERWLDRYVAFMLEPGRHRDTYVEEYHRHFFTNLASGRKPINCGVKDVHIGGLVPVPAIVAGLGPAHPDLRRIVRLHVSLTHKDDGVLAAADALVRMLVRLTREDRPGPTDDLRTVILEEAADWISAAKIRGWERACDASAGTCPDRGAVGGILSPACYIPDAFPAALYLAWRHAGDFAAGAVANARCGGDNCHRGCVVGSLLGATAPVPQPLLEGLRAVDKLVDSPSSEEHAVPGAR